MKPPLENEIRKPTKTMSGVTPIAVMVKPRKCKHGVCKYCPSFNVPQSYTPLSPPVLRAKMMNYDAYEQIKSRLKAFEVMHHPTNKIELIVMGGTFLAYPVKYQKEFIKKCYDALNGIISKDLDEAKKLNENAKNRCVALCIETRPDYANEKDIKRCLEYGATRVELGVQVVDDNIYKKINRGHRVKDVVNATKRFKDAGFKVGYHLMPGLPGSSIKKDLEMFKKIFSDERFKPDQIKIYPCQVIKGAELEKDFKKGKYKPYTLEELQKLLIKMFKIIPEYCRTMRVMREFAPEHIIAGTTRISLRKDIEEELRKLKEDIKEIRFREIGFALQQNKEIDTDVRIKKTIYKASSGKEIFIEAVNKDNILFGLLRLRIPAKSDIEKLIVKELKNCALVREVHVYGKSVEIGEKGEKELFSQHSGIGKMLMDECENIVIKESKNNKNIKKIAVISGVGVREYYRKLGYQLEGSYMIKEI